MIRVLSEVSSQFEKSSGWKRRQEVEGRRMGSREEEGIQVSSESRLFVEIASRLLVEA